MRGPRAAPVAASIAAAMAAAMAGAVCPPIEMAEVAPALGLEFVHRSGASPARHLPESMGAGAAWLDFDGDGWQDLYLLQSGAFPPDGSPGAANRLYRSVEGRRFEDVTEASGLGDRGNGQGAAAGDLDGDGDLDLVVTNFGPDVLFVNRGDGTFDRRELAESGGWSSSAALADVDGDGDLDLYVTSYVEYDPDQAPQCLDTDGVTARYCDPSLFLGARDRLYFNDGRGGLSLTSRLPVEAASGRGLGVVMVDLDGDLAPEVYVANDLTPNALLANDGEGGLTDVSLVSGAAVNREGRSEAGMGIAVLDFDGDLDPDLAVTNFDVETNTLYENLGGSTFRDVSAASGFGPPSLNDLGFGIVPLDVEGDGDPDLWIANGHIFERPNRDNTTYAQASRLLIDAGGRFEAVDCEGPWSRPAVARGAATADFDNDGDLDIVVQSNDGPVQLVENRSGSSSFIGFDLRLDGSGGPAVGAVVTVEEGARRQRLWVTAGDSYQSASEPRRLAALAADRESRTVDVVWRSGARLRLAAPPSGRYLRLPSPRPATRLRRP